MATPGIWCGHYCTNKQNQFLNWKIRILSLKQNLPTNRRVRFFDFPDVAATMPQERRRPPLPSWWGTRPVARNRAVRRPRFRPHTFVVLHIRVGICRCVRSALLSTPVTRSTDHAVRWSVSLHENGFALKRAYYFGAVI